jgi:hypothetical protein
MNGQNAFNVFSAIVFLVAGPAVGFTLTQFTHLFVYLLWNRERYEILREYSLIKLSRVEKENIEFDNIDARITFSRSTGLGLALISLMLILWQPYFSPLPIFLNNIFIRFLISFLIYWSGILLIIGATYDTINVQYYIICKFLKEKEEEIGKIKRDSLCKDIDYDDKRKILIRKTRKRMFIWSLCSFFGSIGLSIVLYWALQLYNNTFSS